MVLSRASHRPAIWVLGFDLLHFVPSLLLHIVWRLLRWARPILCSNPGGMVGRSLVGGCFDLLHFVPSLLLHIVRRLLRRARPILCSNPGGMVIGLPIRLSAENYMTSSRSRGTRYPPSQFSSSSHPPGALSTNNGKWEHKSDHGEEGLRATDSNRPSISMPFDSNRVLLEAE
ncbi:hypothetical protein U1Q18_033034 [Sarracenia purpurea var. burkii]